MSRSVNDSRTNTTTPPSEELKEYDPNMLQLNTVYGITIAPKEQYYKKNFRFKIIMSEFFHLIQKVGISEYVIYPEISSPTVSRKGKNICLPRWHFHGNFQINNLLDYITYYEDGFYKLSLYGSIEIHQKLNLTYPIKNKITMQPICKHYKMPYCITPDNVRSMLKKKDFSNLGKPLKEKVISQLDDSSESDPLGD